VSDKTGMETEEVKQNKGGNVQNVVKEEQERTTIKKDLFLDYFEKLLCDDIMTCQKINIDKRTLLRWRTDDAEFAKKYNDIKYREGEMVESKLRAAIIQGDKPSIRFYLNKRHPEYKDKVINEIVPGGERSMKDILEEFEKEKQNATGNKQQSKTIEQGSGGVNAKDPGQEGADSPIHTESGAGDLLEKKDTPKPVVETKAKGVK